MQCDAANLFLIGLPAVLDNYMHLAAISREKIREQPHLRFRSANLHADRRHKSPPRLEAHETNAQWMRFSGGGIGHTLFTISKTSRQTQKEMLFTQGNGANPYRSADVRLAISQNRLRCTLGISHIN